MKQFLNDYFDRLQDLHQQMVDVLDALPDTAVNWQPPINDINSIAVLVTHAMGAERFWIGDVALGDSSNRVRSDEFINTPKTCAELKAQIQTTEQYIQESLPKITLADLATRKTPPNHNREFSMGWSLLHAMEHTAVHVGHIQIMQQLWEKQQA